MNMKLEPLLPKNNNNHADEIDISGTILMKCLVLVILNLLSDHSKLTYST